MTEPPRAMPWKLATPSRTAFSWVLVTVSIGWVMCLPSPLWRCAASVWPVTATGGVSSPVVLVTGPSLPARSLADFMAQVRQAPGKTQHDPITRPARLGAPIAYGCGPHGRHVQRVGDHHHPPAKTLCITRAPENAVGHRARDADKSGAPMTRQPAHAAPSCWRIV